MFVLSNGNGSYLYRDKSVNLIKSTNDFAMADKYDDYGLAERTLNATPRTLKQFYSPVEVGHPEQSQSVDTVGIMKYALNPDKLDTLTADVYEELKEAVANAIKSNETIRKVRETAIENISVVDNKITDLLHYIEFNRLDCYKGYLAYKALRTLLVERRQLKNTNEATRYIANDSINENTLSCIDKVISTKKHYNARQLKGLFENGIYEED